MLTPGPGLRGARLADLARREAGDGAAWAVATEANGFAGPLYLECVGGKTLGDIDRDVGTSLTFVRDILARV